MKTITISDEAKKAIRESEIGVDRVTLGPPGSLPQKTYKDVVKVLEALGIKWNRKEKCHVGTRESVKELMDAIEDGSVVDKVRERRAEFNFFATIAPVAAKMAYKAYAQVYPKAQRHIKVLEPSAGDGDLLQATLDMFSDLDGTSVSATAVEIDEEGHPDLSKKYVTFYEDFMEWESEHKFDVIIMNPPFSKGRALAHVHKAATKHLIQGGNLICLVGAGAFSPNTKAGAKLKLELMEDFDIELIEKGIVAGKDTKALSEMYRISHNVSGMLKDA